MNSNLKRNLAIALLPIALLAGCAAPQPSGPHVAVMPAPGKPFEVFAAEEQYCRGYAEQSTGGANASDANAQSVAGSAVAGTVIGAAAGSILLGRHGGATGAGLGLIVGSSAGANQGAMTARDIQRRYDIAYQQCMYAKGNQIPGYRAAPVVSAPPAPQYAPPPPPTYPPTYPPQYPPQGNYPPPPPPSR